MGNIQRKRQISSEFSGHDEQKDLAVHVLARF